MHFFELRLKKSVGQKGFTLVELLIVIAIIGVLAAFGLGGSFMQSRRKASDAARRDNINAIQTGFEQYYVANGTYDASSTTCTTMRTTTYFPQLPPSSTDYTYTCGTASPTSYCVCALLESSDPKGNAYSNLCNFNISTGGQKNYFCAVNLQ